MRSIAISKCPEQITLHLGLLVDISDQRLRQSESCGWECFSVEGWPVSVKTNGS